MLLVRVCARGVDEATGRTYTDPVPPRRPRFVPAPAPADSADGLAASLRELRSSLDLDDAYPAEAEAEARRAASEVPVDAAASGLEDLRDIEFLTIDPAGSTDLDQALHLERTPAGAVLHDAIADVPAFVAPGGALDAETRRRGQTMYAPDERIPLHPPVLGDDAASLLPGVDRRAYVWRFELDAGARPIATTLVRSRAQCAYDEAQRAVDAGTAPPTLGAMAWFGAERAARESERGGASLNVPETRIEPDGTGFRLRGRSLPRCGLRRVRRRAARRDRAGGDRRPLRPHDGAAAATRRPVGARRLRRARERARGARLGAPATIGRVSGASTSVIEPRR